MEQIYSVSQSNAIKNSCGARSAIAVLRLYRFIAISGAVTETPFDGEGRFRIDWPPSKKRERRTKDAQRTPGKGHKERALADAPFGARLTMSDAMLSWGMMTHTPINVDRKR